MLEGRFFYHLATSQGNHNELPYLFFVQPNSLPARSRTKGSQRNKICQIDVFYFSESGKLKYMHHTIDIDSEFQGADA